MSVEMEQAADRPSPDARQPLVREAEALVGHEFNDEADITLGLDEIAERGARNVLITHDEGCFALLREGGEERRFRVVAPRLEAVSRIGAGDTLLAGYLAARVAGKPVDEALRSAVATGAASVLEPGPGRFDPKAVASVTGLVQVEPLSPVAQDA